jgi:hypothetical protein
MVGNRKKQLTIFKEEGLLFLKPTKLPPLKPRTKTGVIFRSSGANLGKRWGQDWVFHWPCQLTRTKTTVRLCSVFVAWLFHVYGRFWKNTAMTGCRRA